MITRIANNYKRMIGGLLAIVMLGCSSSDRSDDPIPYTPFDAIYINLNLPTYAKLKSDKNFVYVDGGIRGIILYRASATSYMAFERNCSYHPNEAGSTVNVHSSTLYLEDSYCGSMFSFPNGEPSGGVAWRPLRRYATYLDGTNLTITDEIAAE